MLQLTSGNSRLIFHYEFEEPVVTTRNHSLSCLSNPRYSRARRNCLQWFHVVQSLFDMKRGLASMLVQRRNEITEILHQLRNPSRRTRGLGSLIGSGLAGTFGLATESEVDIIWVNGNR